MTRTGVVVTGIIAIVLVVAGVFAFGRKKDNQPNQNTSLPTSTTSAPSGSSDTSNTTNQPSAATAVISYSGSLFSPSQVTVKKGDSVMVKNDSSSTVDFESNPHPIHTDNPELNIGAVAAGQSKTFTVNKVGSWGYHNHLNSSQTGTIVVR